MLQWSPKWSPIAIGLAWSPYGSVYCKVMSVCWVFRGDDSGRCASRIHALGILRFLNYPLYFLLLFDNRLSYSFRIHLCLTFQYVYSDGLISHSCSCMSSGKRRRVEWVIMGAFENFDCLVNYSLSISEACNKWSLLLSYSRQKIEKFLFKRRHSLASSLSR